jgi:hypothetical protein
MKCELMFMLATWVANFNPLVCGLLASGLSLYPLHHWQECQWRQAFGAIHLTR